ncbi:hypothetical protein DMUE_0186 [Dictyocoela muelleri]|nr:hypothetical protein DMUE_0186 [Dictyocoela muelleri]
MKKRNVSSYNFIFNIIKSKVSEKPRNIIVDFEIASFNSIYKTFENSKIFGCYFHFTQIIIRFLKQNKYIEIYKNNIKYKTFVTYLIFLTYVPLNKILELNKICLLKQNELGYIILISYFKSNFIENNEIISTKERKFWSVNERIHFDIPTTTNSCEAYHRYLNSKISKKNQNIEKNINLLKKKKKG